MLLLRLFNKVLDYYYNEYINYLNYIIEFYCINIFIKEYDVVEIADKVWSKRQRPITCRHGFTDCVVCRVGDTRDLLSHVLRWKEIREINKQIEINNNIIKPA